MAVRWLIFDFEETPIFQKKKKKQTMTTKAPDAQQSNASTIYPLFLYLDGAIERKMHCIVIISRLYNVKYRVLC